MTEIKFNICDKVFFFNTASGEIESGEIKGIQVIPTAVSKDTQGNNVLDGSVVLYSLADGPVLADREVFGSRGECLEYYRNLLGKLS